MLYHLYLLRRVANPRPVATIKKLATGRVAQRQVLARTVGHGEVGRRIWTGFNPNGARVYETGLGDTIEQSTKTSELNDRDFIIRNIYKDLY